MTAARATAATAVGLLLAALPFLHYTALPGSAVHQAGSAHNDHEPRHGGQLGMVGDYHIEVRRRAGVVEAFVSDAWRRPLRARRAWVAFGGGARQELRWRWGRFAGADTPGARRVEALAEIDDATLLRIDFDFSG